jgi:hypothetical protein
LSSLPSLRMMLGIAHITRTAMLQEVVSNCLLGGGECGTSASCRIQGSRAWIYCHALSNENAM